MDFMLEWDLSDNSKGVKVQSADEMKEVLKAIAQSQNKKKVPTKKEVK
jgi:hypothetical protein